MIVHRYPAEMKAFYFKPDPNDAKVALGMDVLAPEGYGEIIGGGQREENLEVLEQRIEQHKLPREAFSWYLDLRRYGSVPHAGFGLGVERTVAWMCGLPPRARDHPVRAHDGAHHSVGRERTTAPRSGRGAPSQLSSNRTGGPPVAGSR